MANFTKEQQQAITLRNSDILVSAAAGSGKTTVMIERVARLIAEGVKVDNILVCTFTKAAAQDMRLKAAKLLKTDDIPAQTFCTLHSFCNHLLKSYFYLLDIDPDFELISEGAMEEERSKIMMAVIKRQVAEDPEFAAIYEGMLKRRNDRAMREALTDIYNTAVNSVNPIEYFRKTADMRKAEAIVDTFRAETSKALEITNIDEFSPHYESVAERQARALGRAAESVYLEYQSVKRKKALVDYSDLEHFTYQILCNPSSANLIRAKYKYVFVDEYQDINPLQDAIISKLSNGGKLFMVGDVKQSIYAFRGCEAKIFQSKYDDFLIQGSRKTSVLVSIAKQSNVSKTAIELNANFRSNPQILSFVNSVFAGIMTPDFGGVDYEKRAMMSGGKILKSTFAPVELQFVVSSSITDNSLPAAKPTVYSVQNDIAKISSSNSAQAESILIYKRITELLAGRIEDEATKELRGVTFDDIVVLMPSLTTLANTLFKVLEEKKIPVAIMGERGIFETPIIKILYNFLKIVDNFELDYELASIMRASYFGNFSDSELAEIRVACKENDAPFWKAVIESKNKKIKDFLAKLQSYTKDSRALTVTRLASKITADFDLFSYAFGAGGDAAVRLSAYLDSLETHQAQELYTYIDFVDNTEHPKLESATGAGCIRIMTMHKSKGLEFPCVIAAGAAKKFNVQDLYKNVTADKDLGICCKAFDTVDKSINDTQAHEAAKESLRRRLSAQNLRLWYVALTRAKISLTVTGAVSTEDALKAEDTADSFVKYYKASRAKCALDWLRINLSVALHNYKLQIINIDTDTARGETIELTRGQSAPIFSQADSTLTEQIKKAIDFAYSFDTTVPPKTSATRLINEAYENEEQEPKFYKIGSEDAENNSDGRGAERGIAYHKTMEAMWATPSRSAYNYAGVVVDPAKIKKCYNSLCTLIGRNRKIYTERNFIARLKLSDITPDYSPEYSLVQGVIDFIAVGESDIIIVDYKTNNKSVSTLACQYAIQMRIYSLAASAAFGKKVKAYIYSFFDDKLFEVSP